MAPVRGARPRRPHPAPPPAPSAAGPPRSGRAVVKGFRIAMAKVPCRPGAQESEDELRAQAFDIMHGDRLVLVDSSARIRGYYVSDDSGLVAILRAARALAAR